MNVQNGLAVFGIIAIIVTSIVAPIVVAVFISARAEKRHREDRQADWDRQDEQERNRRDAADEVAVLAAKAATDLAVSQKRIATTAEAARVQAAKATTLLAQNNELVAQTSGDISGQLTQIHTLVNSDMTKAMQDQYDAVESKLVMMREIVDLKQSLGHEPTPATLAAITATETKLTRLASELEDRAKAQERANHL
jgi:hypothetical protein